MLLAVVVSALASLPAEAATHSIVVTAPGGRWGYLDVASLRVLQPGDLRAQTHGRPVALEITSTDPQGPYTYVVVVWLPGLMTSPSFLGTTNRLEAGRYRVRVLSQGPATFTLGTAEQTPPATQVVRPTRPLKVSTRVAGPVTLAAGPQQQVLRTFAAVPRGSSALLASFVSGTFTGGQQSCATSTASCPAAVPGADAAGTMPMVVTSPRVTSTSGYGPAAQTRDARFSLDGVTAAAGRFAGVSFAYAP